MPATLTGRSAQHRPREHQTGLRRPGGAVADRGRERAQQRVLVLLERVGPRPPDVGSSQGRRLQGVEPEPAGERSSIAERRLAEGGQASPDGPGRRADEEDDLEGTKEPGPADG